jgi:hypothetical protein
MLSKYNDTSQPAPMATPAPPRQFSRTINDDTPIGIAIAGATIVASGPPTSKTTQGTAHVLALLAQTIVAHGHKASNRADIPSQNAKESRRSFGRPSIVVTGCGASLAWNSPCVLRKKRMGRAPARPGISGHVKNVPHRPVD